MAEHLKEVKCGNKTYYISHNGETVYYGISKGKANNQMRGLKFKNNQIIDTSTNKPVMSDFIFCQIIGK